MRNIKTVFSILILLVFCVFFYVGALFVNSETVLTSERRKVSPFYMLKSFKKQELKNFFSRMDTFIADRLLFKDQIFKTISVLHGDYFFDFDIGKAVRGKENWFFLGNSFEQVINKHINDIPSLNKQTLTFIKNMMRLKEASESLDSDFVMVICPDKHGIYHEFLPNYLVRENGREFRYASKVIPLLEQNDIHVVDLNGALKSNKNTGILYYRTDTHWNMLGASVGFKEIYRSTKATFSRRKLTDMGSLPVYKLEKIPSTYGDLISIGGFYNAVLRDDDNYSLKYKTDTNILWSWNGKEEAGLLSKGKGINSATAHNPVQMHNPSAANRMKLVVIGDSFFTALSPFFNAAFSDIVYIAHTIPVEDQVSVIKKFKPDLVVYETVERYI